VVKVEERNFVIAFVRNGTAAASAIWTPDRIITKEIKCYNIRVIEYMLHAGTGELTVRFCVMWETHICVWNCLSMKILLVKWLEKWLQSMDHPVPWSKLPGDGRFIYQLESLTPCIKVSNDRLIDSRFVNLTRSAMFRPL
jgi:hypothetical protein